MADQAPVNKSTIAAILSAIALAIGGIATALDTPDTVPLECPVVDCSTVCADLIASDGVELTVAPTDPAAAKSAGVEPVADVVAE